MNPRTPYRRRRGFTLIELMVVVTIVAILGAIAMPAYNDYVRRSRIAEAVASLSDMRVRLEQYFQDNRSYVGACTAGTLAPLPASTVNFTYTCPALTATAFTVQATGVTGSTMAGFTYTIDQANTRTTVALPSGWSGAGNTCWVLARSGSC